MARRSRVDPRVVAIQKRVFDFFNTSRSDFPALSSSALPVVTVFSIVKDTLASKLTLRVLEVLGSGPSVVAHSAVVSSLSLVLVVGSCPLSLVMVVALHEVVSILRHDIHGYFSIMSRQYPSGIVATRRTVKWKPLVNRNVSASNFPSAPSTDSIIPL